MVMKNQPIYYVYGPEIRCFSRFEANIGRRTIVNILLKLFEPMEKRIALQMKQTRGVLLFDDWSCNATHF